MDKKLKIKELRAKGYGYKKIGEKLLMKPDAVRYICNKMEKDALIGICKNCGKTIKSIKGKKKKTYCSDKCRWDWWNKQRKGLNTHDPY